MKITFIRAVLVLAVTFAILICIEEVVFASSLQDEHCVAYKEYYVLNKDMEALRHAVNSEARGEGEFGMELVVEVILNRVESDEFPSTIYEVVYQRNAFDGMNYETPITDDSIIAINNVFERGTQHKKILFFQGAHVEDSWITRNRQFAFKYNNHNFYY